MLRAAERGLGPEDLIKVGRDAKRDEWVAAGKFARQYEQVTLLAGADSAAAQESAPALDAAELVASALLAFETDAELLAGERDRVRYLLVDDAQHLDPLQYRLLARLGFAAKEFVLAGDPDQAVFSFRGADPRLLADTQPDGGTVVLRETHRMAPAVRQAVARLAARLPGAAPQRPTARRRRTAERGRPGRRPPARHRRRRGRVGRRPAAPRPPHRRRALVGDGRSWSAPPNAPRRSCSARSPPPASRSPPTPTSCRWPASPPSARSSSCCASRPTRTCSTPPARRCCCPASSAAPTRWRCAGCAAALRRLELASGRDRPSDELLVEVLRDERRARRARRGRGRERAPGRRAAGAPRAGPSPRTPASSRCCGWSGRRAGSRTAGSPSPTAAGPLGAQADRDLDAIVGLFHAAGRYADRLPGAGVTGFAEFLAAQRIVGDTLAPSAQRGAGRLGHHRARRRRSRVDGRGRARRAGGHLAGPAAARLAARRRAADRPAVRSGRCGAVRRSRRCSPRSAGCCWSRPAGRGTRCCCPRSAARTSSRPGSCPRSPAATSRRSTRPARLGGPNRALVLADLVGELRRAVCDGTAPAERRRRAARQLARLAEAGVPGADPDVWYGLPELSSDAAAARGGRADRRLTVHSGGSGALPAALDGRAARRPGPGRAGVDHRRARARARPGRRGRRRRGGAAGRAGPRVGRRGRRRAVVLPPRARPAARDDGHVPRLAARHPRRADPGGRGGGVLRRRAGDARARAGPGRPARGRRRRPPGGRRREDRPGPGHRERREGAPAARRLPARRRVRRVPQAGPGRRARRRAAAVRVEGQPQEGRDRAQPGRRSTRRASSTGPAWSPTRPRPAPARTTSPGRTRTAPAARSASAARSTPAAAR